MDLLGLVLCAAAAAWTIVAGVRVGGNPWPAVGLIAAMAAAVGIGRSGARLATWGPAACIVAVGTGAAVVWGAQTWSASSWNGVLGYANARACFFAVVASAALQVAVAARRFWPIAVGFAALAATVPVTARSVAATVLLALGGILFLLGLLPGRRRLAVTLAGAITGAVLLGTLILGAAHGPGTPADDVLEERLSTRRLTLWHESLVLMVEHPITGVGPGRFREASPTARRDPDAAWAHNGFLQQGAETGIPGLLVAVALMVWGFVRVRRASGPLAPSAAAALMAVGAQACVDYVLHSPVVPIAAALLVGAGSVATGTRDDRRIRPRERTT